jgi:drug/metabolite transporter (DMT)-like permease
VDFGDVVAVCAAFMWASTTLLARYLSKTVPPVWCNASRCVVATLIAVVVMPWVLSLERVTSLSWVTIAALVLSVVCGLGIGDTVFFESMRRIGVARALPVGNLHPVMAAGLAAAFLGEQITTGLMGGVALVLCGLWLITSDDTRRWAPAAHDRRSIVIGFVLALIAAVAWAGSGVSIKPALSEINAVEATVLRTPLAGVLLMLTAMGREGAPPLRRMTKRTYAVIVFSGVVMLVSTAVFMEAVALVGAARTSAISSASPLFATPLAIVFFGERVTRRLVLGCLLAWCGVAVILFS